MTKKALTGVLDKLELTDAERSYLETSHTATTADITLSQAVGTIYSVKHRQKQVDQSVAASQALSNFVVERIEGAVNRMIESDEGLARSNEKHARAMTYLTTVIAFATVAQVGVAIASYLLKP